MNLNGHTIFGTPNAGDGSGVLVPSHFGVTVENGTVTAFDGGVVIVNGGGNTVTGIVAEGNIGSSGDPNVADTLMGDGILLEGSSGNVIKGNTAANNGPFSGIGMISVPDSDHNFPAEWWTSIASRQTDPDWRRPAQRRGWELGGPQPGDSTPTGPSRWPRIAPIRAKRPNIIWPK